MGRNALLLAVALWAVWLPAELLPWTAVAIALAVMLLLPGAQWCTRRDGRWQLKTVGIFVLFLVASAIQGIDLATASGEVALLTAVVALMVLAAEKSPDRAILLAFAIGLVALSIWAVFQVTVGFERAMPEVGSLPVHLQRAATLRLESGRAFASLLLPSHLAVILATALPLLVGRLGAGLWLPFRIMALVLCLLGLVLTVSPVGVALAVGACLVVVLRGFRGRVQVAVVVVLLLSMGAVTVARSDLADLEPVRLRLDNWNTAVWLWSSAKVSGVGLGSYGQASQAVPFDVGNRPQHAHCLPLEWAAELGVVGLVLALAGFAALYRLARRLWSEHVEVAAAVLVIPLHNLVDFSLYTSAVALPWAVLVGWAVALSRAPDDAPRPVRRHPARLLLGGAFLTVAALWAGSVVLLESAAVDDDSERAFSSAVTAHDLAPWTAAPLARVAQLGLDSGDPVRARAALDLLRQSRWVRPGSPLLAAFRSQLSLACGEVPSAVSEAWAARRQQPSNHVYQENLEYLIGELELARRRERH